MSKLFSKVYFIAILTLIFVACSKDDPEGASEPCVLDETHVFPDTAFHIGIPGDMEYGFATAIKLGKEWVGSALAFDQDSVFTIAFGTRPIPGGRIYEEIYISSLPKENGCYALSPQTRTKGHADYSIIGDHQSLGRFTLLEEDQVINRLEVTSITEDSVFGRFSASFVDTSGGDWPEPDYVRYYNGAFEIKFR
jgi:hypothetical protein